MERKIVKQGVGTMTLSLPMSWVKNFNLKSGDVVEVSEMNKLLIVSSSKIDRSMSIRINLKNRSPSFVRRKLLGLYVYGYDEVVIEHIDQFDEINNLTTQMIGFCVLKNEGNLVVLKDLGSIGEVEFKDIFQRTLKILIEQIALAINLLKTHGDLNKLIKNDYHLNQLSDYCLRYLSKKGFSDYKKTSLYYVLVSDIEYVGDIISDLEHTYKVSDQKIILKLLDAIERLLAKFQLLLFTFSDEKADEILIEAIGLIENNDGRSSPGVAKLLEIPSKIKDMMNYVLLLNV